MMSACRTLLLCLAGAAGAVSPLSAAPEEARRIEALELELRATRREVEALRQAVDRLLAERGAAWPREVQAEEPAAGIHSGDHGAAALAVSSTEPSYQDRMLVPDLGADERAETLTPKPEVFVQTRYQSAPIDEATADDVTRHFTLSRMELRWAGRVTDDIGLGFEVQYHPAPDGAPEELVNDAFAEYYLNDAVTIRGGQFIKPFGFDIQHSSSARESPERGIFAGYFFPGQRDRGLMVAADLGQVRHRWRGTSVYAGVFNGNRFFNDADDKLNYNFRVRKQFDSMPLALGASVQLGHQLQPAGGDGRDNLYGVDVQFVASRWGVRAEYVRGDMPSTLLGLEPEFAPAYAANETSSGAALFLNYRVSSRNELYWRYDRFRNDPVTGADVNAFNVGYRRRLSQRSLLGVDYQIKDGLTFNDDDLNTKLAITWNVNY